METRILIAYALIALMVAAVIGVIVYYQRKRDGRRRTWQPRSHRSGQ